MLSSRIDCVDDSATSAWEVQVFFYGFQMSMPEPTNAMNKTRSKSVKWLILWPLEVRDIIYEYALTEEGGFIADDHSDANSLPCFRANNGFLENKPTRLHLVCRQLEAETSGLLLRYNAFTFIDTSWSARTNAYQHFTRFVESCSRDHLSRIRRVTIFDGQTPVGWTAWRQLQGKCGVGSVVERFCRDFPDSTVIVRLKWKFNTQWHLRCDYVACMDAIHHVRYGVTLFPGYSPRLRPNHSDPMHLQMTTEYFAFQRLSNLRFTHTFAFEERLARRVWEEAGHSGAELEELVKRVKEAHERGI